MTQASRTKTPTPTLTAADCAEFAALESGDQKKVAGTVAGAYQVDSDIVDEMATYCENSPAVSTTAEI